MIKPLIGREQDVHSDASVVRPVLSSEQGVALSTGILPSYGDIDPYAMAECGIDTAFRNVVAAGADPDRVALLEQFLLVLFQRAGAARPAQTRGPGLL